MRNPKTHITDVGVLYEGFDTFSKNGFFCHFFNFFFITLVNFCILLENIYCYKWNESIWTFIKMECVHIILSGLSTNLLLLTLYGLLRTFGLDLEGGGISIQRWLYQYISCYSKTISSSNTLNIDQGLFYHNTLVSRTTSHVKNGNGVKSVTMWRFHEKSISRRAGALQKMVWL